MTEKLDIILFGATGVTGKHAIPMIAKYSKEQNRRLTWGIAGRSEEKLRKVLKEYQEQTKLALSNIPIIIADVQDEDSLKEMARKARIIINCCGPFRFYGEPVVKACVEEGTHHVDVTAEIQYMEKMQLKYHEEAQKKGIYIISACGYESIPVDLGIVYLQQHFEGTLNSVVAYLQYWEEDRRSSGTAINYGTWESMVLTLANREEVREIRRHLFPNRLPDLKPKLKLGKILLHKSDAVGVWAFPLHITDFASVRRSQRLFYEKHSRRPIQIETCYAVESFFYMILLLIFGGCLLLLLQFSLGIKLLLKYPQLFSLGFVNRQTPSEERSEKGLFKTTLYAEGWKEILPNATDQYTTPPDKAMVLRVKGRNPGYGATCICLVLAAITVITETDKMPQAGGVYPPGYAFANTSLINQLKQHGISFDISDEKKI